MTALLTTGGVALMLSGRMEHPTDVRFHTAWGEGSAACLARRPLTDNPYLPDTVSGWGWASGWADADSMVSALAGHLEACRPDHAAQEVPA
ncbi:hypothetical protein ACCD06_33685 [Azospirillum sp. CT11-132]|uniref:hypothetical protein n=1 Tax=Azospirillum sp. CT11-132 TaxID=3396317 RepID=UPI0039A670A0